MNIKKAKEVKTRKNLIKYKSKMTFKYWMFSFLGSFMAVNNVINFVLKKNQLRLNFHKVILFGEYIFNYKSQMQHNASYWYTFVHTVRLRCLGWSIYTWGPMGPYWKYYYQQNSLFLPTLEVCCPPSRLAAAINQWQSV